MYHMSISKVSLSGGEGRGDTYISNVLRTYYWAVRDTRIIVVSAAYQACITCRHVIHVLQPYHERIIYVLQNSY